MASRSEPASPLLLNPMRFPTARAQFDERVQLALGYPTILIVIWPDHVARNAAMREAAEDAGGLLIDSKGMRSRRLLRALEEQMKIPSRLSSFERYRAISDALATSRGSLFLDNADVFDRLVLRILRDFYNRARTSTVIGTATTKLAPLIDDRESGGELFSRSAVCDLRS
ncbi:MAG: hypothetical protein IT430_20700 [Phycisphaerales bacterium]|nr:hypothetical protein [Phycisphaerales bacterium]